MVDAITDQGGGGDGKWGNIIEKMAFLNVHLYHMAGWRGDGYWGSIIEKISFLNVHLYHIEGWRGDG